MGSGAAAPAPAGGVNTRPVQWALGSHGLGPVCVTGLYCHLVFVTEVEPQLLLDGKGSIPGLEKFPTPEMSLRGES